MGREVKTQLGRSHERRSGGEPTLTPEAVAHSGSKHLGGYSHGTPAKDGHLTGWDFVPEI